MKRSFVLQLIIGICMLTLIVSCHKRGEYEVPCRLLKIAHVDRSSTPNPYASFAGYLEYTSWGDPSKITWDITTTGRPNYIFNYDHKRRLKEFIGSHGFNYEFYTKYLYSGDKITSDTTWISGQMSDVRGTAYLYYVSHYTFDSKGRVSRIDSQDSFGNPPSTTTYSYDANGNKIRGDGAVYDNKKSYLRTNVVLMFITRDYSMNNYKTADTYNNKGLPLAYNSTVVTFMNSLVNEFDYNCDYKNH